MTGCQGISNLASRDDQILFEEQEETQKRESFGQRTNLSGLRCRSNTVFSYERLWLAVLERRGAGLAGDARQTGGVDTADCMQQVGQKRLRDLRPLLRLPST
jgi:hypothetical protein